MRRKMTFKPTATQKHSRGKSMEETILPGQGGRFVQGYDEKGALVYVPVDNLEAMKTLVNMKLRHRRESTFSRVPDMSSEQKELNKYLAKLEGLVEKLDRPQEHEEMEELDELSDTVDDSQLIHKIKEQIHAQRRKSRMSRAFPTGGIPRIERNTIIDPDKPVPNGVEVKTENDTRKSKITFVPQQNIKTSIKESIVTPPSKVIPNVEETKNENDTRKSKNTSIPQQNKTSTKESIVTPPSKVIPNVVEAKNENSPRQSKITFIPQQNKTSIKESTATPSNRIERNDLGTKTRTTLRKLKVTFKPQQNKISIIKTTTPPNRIIPNDQQTKTKNVSLKSTVTFKPLQDKSLVKTNKTLQHSPTTSIKGFRSLTTIPKSPTEKHRKKKTRFKKTENKAVDFMKKPEPKIYPYFKGMGDMRNDSKTVRFFICGLFKNDQHPIFLVQPYVGNSLLGKKKLPLDSETSENDIDVYVSGEFYQRNILDVGKDMAASITIGNRKINIDRKSVMFDEGITDALSTSELFIVVGGDFIRHGASPFITPSLFIGVERNIVRANKKLNTQVSRKQFFLPTPKIPTSKKKMSQFRQRQERNEKLPESMETHYSRNNRVSSEGAFVFYPNIPVYTVETRGCKLSSNQIEETTDETLKKVNILKTERIHNNDTCTTQNVICSTAKNVSVNTSNDVNIPIPNTRKCNSEKITCFTAETGELQTSQLSIGRKETGFEPLTKSLQKEDNFKQKDLSCKKQTNPANTTEIGRIFPATQLKSKKSVFETSNGTKNDKVPSKMKKVKGNGAPVDPNTPMSENKHFKLLPPSSVWKNKLYVFRNILNTDHYSKTKQKCHKEASITCLKIPVDTIEIRGFEPLETRTEGNETFYEFSPGRNHENTPSDTLMKFRELSVYEIQPPQRLSSSPLPVISRTMYGDELEDVDTEEHALSTGPSVYECGRILRSKSDIALKLNSVHSKTEYGDFEVNQTKSVQDLRDENTNRRSKFRKPHFLRRLNNIITNGERRFNLTNRFKS